MWRTSARHAKRSIHYTMYFLVRYFSDSIVSYLMSVTCHGTPPATLLLSMHSQTPQRWDIMESITGDETQVPVLMHSLTHVRPLRKHSIEAHSKLVESSIDSLSLYILLAFNPQKSEIYTHSFKKVRAHSISCLCQRFLQGSSRFATPTKWYRLCTAIDCFTKFFINWFR